MKEEKTYKYISKEDALARLRKFCDYQDRCHQEVRTKLIEIGCYGDDLENVMCDLIADNFLNEERFARSYARGKFRLKQWGKVRIRQELKLRKISAYCMKKAFEEIDEEEYESTLRKLLEKKAKNIKAKNRFEKNAKLAKYMMQKGYESFLVWEILKNEEF